MAMAAGGLAKVMEECGELIQIAAKKIAYPDTDEHPDGKGSMKERLEDEIADVIAATTFITENFNLDEYRIYMRAGVKIRLFRYWDSLP